jgi:hypothetical protein
MSTYSNQQEQKWISKTMALYKEMLEAEAAYNKNAHDKDSYDECMRKFKEWKKHLNQMPF